MKIIPKYSNRIIAIPGGVLDCIGEAGRCELAVLIYVMSNQNATISACVSDLGISRERLVSALDYWSEAGVLSYSGIRAGKKNADSENSQKFGELDEISDKNIKSSGVNSALKKEYPGKSSENTSDNSVGSDEFMQMTITASSDVDDTKNESYTSGSLKDDSSAKRKSGLSVKALRSAAELPSYTSEEVSGYAKDNETFSGMLYACQQSLGKMFNVVETEMLFGLVDYLRLTPEYIMMLCAYCGRIGKTSVRYMEKTAIGFYDDGITTADELEAHIAKLEAASAAESKLRAMFGIGKRALSKKEKKIFSCWCGEWKFTPELIRRAYDIAVDKTGDSSIPYTNGILQRWYDNGCRTEADVDAMLEKYKKSKEQSVSEGGSFNTDDFFEAAIKRSYGA